MEMYHPTRLGQLYDLYDGRHHEIYNPASRRAECLRSFLCLMTKSCYEPVRLICRWCCYATTFPVNPFQQEPDVQLGMQTKQKQSLSARK